MIEYIIAVCIVGYAFFASLMWWTKASDCKYYEDRYLKYWNRYLELGNRVRNLESTIKGIGKLCNRRKDGAK